MSELRVLACAVLLAAGVSAAVSAAAVRIASDGGPRIASVRLAELAAEHAAMTARADASPEETAAAIRAWAAALEYTLDEIAVRRNVVLLPARAVAAGVPDVTDTVRLAVADSLGRARPEPGP